MEPEAIVYYIVVSAFLIGVCGYMAFGMAVGDLPESLGELIVWILVSHIIGLTFVGSAILENGWLHAICGAIAMVYSVCTLGFGVLFLPAMILAGWIRLFYYILLKLRDFRKDSNKF